MIKKASFISYELPRVQPKTQGSPAPEQAAGKPQGAMDTFEADRIFRRPPILVTTFAYGEEGTYTTLAYGEEGGVTTLAYGEEGTVTTLAWGEEGTYTTLAYGEEGGVTPN